MDTQPNKNIFNYFYVCLDALKRGWLGVCRRIIGHDGIFLRSACKGQLLSTVGKKRNHQMFPIAWAVIESKNLWS